MSDKTKKDLTRVCSVCGCVVADWPVHRKYHDVISATWEELARWVADHDELPRMAPAEEDPDGSR